MLSLRLPVAPDWEKFFSLAAEEGWRIPHLERRLFQGPWWGFARVLHRLGTFCGLVTAVPHQQSGWIGNLLVPPDLRGSGYGSRLFQAALDELLQRQLFVIWLTASESGKPIYEKSGFVGVDRIERWLLPARSGTRPSDENVESTRETLFVADQKAWGESRETFLDFILPYSQVITCGSSVALLQQGADLQILGPWYSEEPSLNSNGLLLQKSLDAADPSREMVVDLIASSGLQQIMAAAGFHCIGQNTLMARGDLQRVKLQTMVSLASLGSVG